MTDIVKQLRNYGLSHLKGTPSVIAEAADEIERLRARAEAAEKRVEELEARIRVMEHDHGIDLSLAASRAEAAEEELAALEYEYRNTEPI